MGIIDRLLGTKTTVTAEAIRSKIATAETEIIALREKIKAATVSTALLSDEAHVKIESEIAADRRAVARKLALIEGLNEELPEVIAAEEAAAKANADAALAKRADAARKLTGSEAKKLLASYAEHAGAIADILARLGEIDAETAAVNDALRSNPGVAESIESYNTVHRSTPGTDAMVHHERRKVWVYRFPGSPADTEKTSYQYEAPREEVREATIGDDGKVVPVGPAIHNYYGRELYIKPTLEEREIVVRRSYARPRSYAPTLNDVRLPPVTGTSYIWPRQS